MDALDDPVKKRVPFEMEKFLMMDILNMSMNEVSKLEPMDYLVAKDYCWTTYNIRSFYAPDSKTSGKGGEPSITYNKPNFGKDFSRTPDQDLIRKMRFNKLKERMKNNKIPERRN